MTINPIFSTPASRQRVVDALVIDDVAGYTDKRANFIAGYATASWNKELMELSTLGLSQTTEELISQPKADVTRIQQQLFDSLSSNAKRFYEELRERLTDTEQKTDLIGIMPEIGANRTLDARERQAIIDLLIIDDVAGYTNKSDQYVPGYANVSWNAHLFEIQTRAALSQDVEDAVSQPKANLIAIQEQVLGGLSAAELAEYERIRDEYLTDPEGRCDLFAALAQVDSDSPLCEVAAAPVEIIEIQGYNPPTLQSGQTLESGLTIYGKGLKGLRIISITSPIFPGSGVMPAVASDDCGEAPGMTDDTRCTDDFITTNPFVVADLTAGYYQITVKHDGGELSFPIQVANPASKPVDTTWDVDPLMYTIRPDLALTLGLPIDVGGEMNPIAAAVGERTPVVTLEAGVEPEIVGRHGIVETDIIDLDLHLRGGYSYADPDMHRGHLTAGMAVTAPVLQSIIRPEVSFDFTRVWDDQNHPNRFFTGEDYNQYDFRLSMSSDFDQPVFDTQVYFQLHHESSDHAQSDYRMGAELHFLRDEAAGFLPAFTLDGYGLWGNLDVPERISETKFVDQILGEEGGGLKLRAQWSAPTKMFLEAGWERRELETYGPTDSGYVRWGGQFGAAGRYGVEYIYNEFDPFYESTAHGFGFSYSPTQARWNAFDVELNYLNFSAPRVPNGRGGTDGELFVGLKLEPIKLFIPGYDKNDQR